MATIILQISVAMIIIALIIFKLMQPYKEYVRISLGLIFSGLTIVWLQQLADKPIEISLALFSLFLGSCIAEAFKSLPRKRTRFVRPIVIMMITIFISIFTLYLNTTGQFAYGRFPASFHSTMGVFALENNPKEFMQEYIETQNPMQNNNDSNEEALDYKTSTQPDNWLIWVLFLAAPIVTFTFIITLFKDFHSWLVLKFHFLKDRYFFSQLNPETLNLAKDIRQGNPKALIAFFNVDRDDESSGLLYDAEELRPLFFKDGIEVITAKSKNTFHNIYWFCASEKKDINGNFGAMDDASNVSDALEIKKGFIKKYTKIEKKKEKKAKKEQKKKAREEKKKEKKAKKEQKKKKKAKEARLFVYASSNESDLLINSTSKNAIEGFSIIRRNIAKQLIWNEMYKNAEFLFHSPKDESTTIRRSINALILGLTPEGKEMAKVLTWILQIRGIEVNLTIFDSNPHALSHFKAEIPGWNWINNKASGVDDEHLHITLYENTDFKSYEFREKIRNLQNITYCFTALKDDEDTIEIAKNVERLLKLSGCNDNLTESVAVLRNIRTEEDHKALLCNKESSIRYIGDTCTLWTMDFMNNMELEKKALKQQHDYENKNNAPLSTVSQFVNDEYSYYSTCASQLYAHTLQKILENESINKDIEDTGLSDFRKYINDNSNNIDIEKQLMQAEHTRWCAYMHTTGHIYKGASKIHYASHKDLQPYSKLDEKEQKKDISCYKTIKDEITKETSPSK